MSEFLAAIVHRSNGTMGGGKVIGVAGTDAGGIDHDIRVEIGSGFS